MQCMCIDSKPKQENCSIYAVKKYSFSLFKSKVSMCSILSTCILSYHIAVVCHTIVHTKPKSNEF